MKSKGFEVSLNGKKIVRAGLPKENYVISCTLHTVHRKDGSGDLYLHVGGLDSESDQNVGWYGEELKVGDSISVVVIDNQFDPPKTTSPKMTEEEIREDKIRYYHQLKEELKDYLEE